MQFSHAILYVQMTTRCHVLVRLVRSGWLIRLMPAVDVSRSIEFDQSAMPSLSVVIHQAIRHALSFAGRVGRVRLEDLYVTISSTEIYDI